MIPTAVIGDLAPSGTLRAHTPSCAVSYKWTITGWSAGRPLAANILRTASGLPASAPRP